MSTSTLTDSMKSGLSLIENSLNLAAITVALAGVYLFQTLLG